MVSFVPAGLGRGWAVPSDESLGYFREVPGGTGGWGVGLISNLRISDFKGDKEKKCNRAPD
jgi:hypothetical protein